jgi:hypothetical protein
MDQPEMPPGIRALQDIFNNPAVQRCIAGVEMVAGYRLSEADKRPFLTFHAYISGNPPPAYITLWRSDARTERWYHEHVNGIFGMFKMPSPASGIIATIFSGSRRR